MSVGRIISIGMGALAFLNAFCAGIDVPSRPWTFLLNLCAGLGCAFMSFLWAVRREA